jgi:hypothetical protein
MLWKALRHIPAFLFTALLVGSAIWGAYQSSLKSLELPTEAEIGALENVSASLSSGERQTVIRSRSSAVQVMSMDLDDAGISVSTGTYIKIKGKYFVLTTSHGVGDACMFTQIIVGEEIYECKQYILRDPQTDYLIMQINPIPSRQAVLIPTWMPRGHQWETALATQNTIFYTGFPNQGGPYTFDGRIVAYRETEAIFVDSYGWSGSSGAGVFSSDGKLIGYIMALEVGETYFGRQVLENFIWVIPLFKVDWLAVEAFAN